MCKYLGAKIFRSREQVERPWSESTLSASEEHQSMESDANVKWRVKKAKVILSQVPVWHCQWKVLKGHQEKVDVPLSSILRVLTAKCGLLHSTLTKKTEQVDISWAMWDTPKIPKNNRTVSWRKWVFDSEEVRKYPVWLFMRPHFHSLV